MRDNGHDYLIGCASIGMADGGHNAASVYARLAAQLSPPEYRVFPRCRLPLERLNAAQPAECRPCSRATCGRDPTFAASRRGIRISTPPTCFSCCRCPA